jgi:hypothetical protein
MHGKKPAGDGYDRFYFCMENNLPIVVFDMNKPGVIFAGSNRRKVGTLVTSWMNFYFYSVFLDFVKNLPGQNWQNFISFHCEFIHVKH